MNLEVRLSRSDLESALDFLREAGELDGAEPFTPELLQKLASLVRCDGLTYAEIDRVRRAIVFQAVDQPGEGAGEEAYWATLHLHPVRRHRTQTGELGAFKIYDFVTWRELQRTQFYTDFLCAERGPGYNRGFLISVCLPAPSGHTRTFTLTSDGRVDFGERERTLLELLQPHLLQLRRAAEVRRRARAATAAVPDGVLTDRELEVLLHVAEGMRNREIAHALWIAPGTVRKHLDNIYAKLGVHSRAAAAARARVGELKAAEGAGGYPESR